jgi:hypothetical protein
MFITLFMLWNMDFGSQDRLDWIQSGCKAKILEKNRWMKYNYLVSSGPMFRVDGDIDVPPALAASKQTQFSPGIASYDLPGPATRP